MNLTKTQRNDLKFVMSAEEEMLPFFGLFKPANGVLNPWQREFPKVFRKLNLQKGMVVVDAPCGQGGVSIPLALKYGVRVKGYDLLPAYIKYAKGLAREKGVSSHCTFKTGDVRDVVKEKDICDLFLWVGAPHVWGKAKPTVKKLRNIVRPGGRIVIADAYIMKGVRRKPEYSAYERLPESMKGYETFGDEIIDFYDQGLSLWEYDYMRTRREIVRGINRAKTKKAKEIVTRYLEGMDHYQEDDTKDLGLGIWVLRVNK